MSESVSGVNAIVNGLREAWTTADMHNPNTRVVELADAEAAVHATIREIVAFAEAEARAIPLGDRSEDSYNVAIRLVRDVARRFGGTEEPMK